MSLERTSPTLSLRALRTRRTNSAASRKETGFVIKFKAPHYRIYELKADDSFMDGYSVICRSDTAALAMACEGAAGRAAASMSGRADGASPALTR